VEGGLGESVEPSMVRAPQGCEPLVRLHKPVVALVEAQRARKCIVLNDPGSLAHAIEGSLTSPAAGLREQSVSGDHALVAAYSCLKTALGDTPIGSAAD
jgi:hypothetical protein